MIILNLRIVDIWGRIFVYFQTVFSGKWYSRDGANYSSHSSSK